MRQSRGKYTGEKIKVRREKQTLRSKHIEAVKKNEIEEEVPEPLFPEVFQDIQTIYWEVLKRISDPRNPKQRVYPLYLILHRIIAGFIGGNKYIGVLFPKKRVTTIFGKTQLGALPTRKTVYELLRKIDWAEANTILAPLWQKLGHTPNLIVSRNFENPRKIQQEANIKRDIADKKRRKELADQREENERMKGMSAAKAKNPKRNLPKPIKPKTIPKKISVPDIIKTQHNLVIDGKVVKASYNNGVQERFVHVTEIKLDKNENRSRFIIGTRPTELDRNGEWGAAMSILETLTPLPGDVSIVISGDAGFSVEAFCEWLTENGFFLFVQNKTKRR